MNYIYAIDENKVYKIINIKTTKVGVIYWGERLGDGFIRAFDRGAEHVSIIDKIMADELHNKSERAIMKMLIEKVMKNR